MTENQKKLLPTKLKELRLLSGLSQKEVADKLFITRTCWSNYERGEREPNIEMLHKIADFFDIDVKYFLEFDKSQSDIDDFIVQKQKVYNYLTKDGYLNLGELSTLNKLTVVGFYKYLKEGQR